ncbi:50S ribosomal protein L15 [Solitalea lacus]|uniref:50S ribosomal protein L15 n=1 Tax=Solitalea lacus TaxID=2911172 RepID=UPI001EDADF02|nr:50S ribosomal protein L15 [Solitalea lacus]UKJ07098.1 50S ribosomal protein L15 [Solitalea lacus]
MNLSSLKPAEGSVKHGKRIGRGTGSGKGGTSTRGHKGAGSRSGTSTKIGFEGGQMPLQRRLPKVGFKNINRVEYVGINLDVLQGLAEKFNLSVIDNEAMRTHGLVSKSDLVKILGRGELKAKLEVKAHAFSTKAAQAIEALGGVVVKL